MVAGCLLLTVNDALIKWVTRDHPIAQSMFIRGLFVMVPILLLAQRNGGLASFRVQRWGLQLLRGALSVVATFLYIIALGLMPLADAVAITFAAPLMITALAPWTLGETVGWRRRLAVAAGFSGVLVMLRPGQGSVQLAALLPLGVAVCEAVRDLVTRRMVRSESSVSMTAVSSVMVTLAGGLVAIGDWRSVSTSALWIMALCGLLMGSAHFLMVEAFRHAEAAIVAPFRYSSVLWAVLIGIALFQDWPDIYMLLGSAIVICSGLYILRREILQGAVDSRGENGSKPDA